MKRYIVAGGTGYIGALLATALHERGDEVVVFSRTPERSGSRLPEGVRMEKWTPTESGPWQALMEGADGVVNLAGEVLVGRRYTPELEREFVRSRVGITERIVEGMEALERRPEVFLCASAIGYYGVEHGDEGLTERDPPGSDFLATICVDWEKAAAKASDLGVRTLSARLGIVLGRGAPALRSMARPFRLCVGGPIGSGQQMFSWVHERDAINMLLIALDNPNLRGPFNVTAPNACSNHELSRAMGRALGRPSWLRVPAFGLRLLFGDGAEPILGGQRVLPERLQGLGFKWQYSDIDAALAEALSEEGSR